MSVDAQKTGRVVLVLACGLALVRVLIREPVFDTPSSPPGGFAIPALLNALCVIPALLAAWGKNDGRRIPAVLGVLGLLALLAGASAFWSASRFQAVMAAGNTAAAACLGYAVFRSIRSTADLALIFALFAGVVAGLGAQSIMYLVVDRPALVQWWEQNREAQLQQMGMAGPAGGAFLIEGRIASKQLMGNFLSPNTLAAVVGMATVLMTAAGVGAVSRRKLAGLVPLSLACCAALLIWGAGGRTAGGVTFCIGLAVAVLALGGLSRKQAVFVRWIVVAGIVIGAAGILTVGPKLDRSMAFRRAYWEASLKVFAEHPWLGVGWGNLGWFYPEHRLPGVPEEIKEPHNFIVRAVSELGAIGGVIALVWIALLSRDFWQSWEPMEEESSTAQAPPERRGDLLAVGIGGVTLACGIAALGLTGQMPALPRFASFVCVAMAVCWAMLKVSWIADRSQLLVGLGGVVLTGLQLSMMDILFIEPAAFMVYVLAGAGLAAGLKIERHVGVPNSWKWGEGSVICAVSLGLIWAATHIIHAEQAALRAGKADEAGEALWTKASQQAGDLDRGAYHVSKATDILTAGVDSEHVLAELQKAKRINRREPTPYSMEASVLERSPDPFAAEGAYEQMLRYNPGDLQTRIRYVTLLSRTGQSAAASEQARQVLWWNDQLDSAQDRVGAGTQDILRRLAGPG